MDEQARRTYLRIQRHQLLAPAHAILELCRELALEPRAQASERFINDLEVVRSQTQRLADMVADLTQSASASDEDDAATTRAQLRIINHDLRGVLTIVIGYAQELRRAVSKIGLEDLDHELEQIEKLGKQLTGLIDEVVAELKGEREPRRESSSVDIQGIAANLLKASEESPIQPGRLLVVEDDELARNALESNLRSQGHDVESVSDGIAALTRLREHSTNFDLVLLDIILPGANGFEVLSEMKSDARLQHVPVIVISGLGEMDEVIRGIQLGAADYLSKPFDQVLLKARINACLEKKRLQDQNEWERHRYDMLLRDILPDPIVESLKQSDTIPPQRHDGVAVLFADLVGFTSYCDHHCPEDVVSDLQYLFLKWEEIANDCGVQKIKTIGDAFMAASGLLVSSENPVLDCVRCGQGMIAATRAYREGWNLRVGIHYGTVVAGVLGRRQFLYDLWGDTVNTASRMESNGAPSCVNLSECAWKQIASHFSEEPDRTRKQIKGKDEMEIIHLREP